MICFDEGHFKVEQRIFQGFYFAFTTMLWLWIISCIVEEGMFTTTECNNGPVNAVLSRSKFVM